MKKTILTFISGTLFFVPLAQSEVPADPNMAGAIVSVKTTIIKFDKSGAVTGSNTSHNNILMPNVDSTIPADDLKKLGNKALASYVPPKESEATTLGLFSGITDFLKGTPKTQTALGEAVGNIVTSTILGFVP
ncbi:MAG: hypothetical protein Q8L85_08165 [Alphaproteobacteria bacterium]|nr:hypothetical protein [Alphaproteobacteria bacterium]